MPSTPLSLSGANRPRRHARRAALSRSIPLTLPLSILMLAAFNGNALAYDANGNYAIWGYGKRSCNAYTSVRLDEQDSEFRHHLMGYLTAYNTYTPDTANVTGRRSLGEITEWLDSYCEQHPMDSFDRALKMLVTESQPEATATVGAGWGRPPKPQSDVDRMLERAGQ